MKYALTKDQMLKIKDMGVTLTEIKLTPYEEILDTHVYDVKEGLNYVIYSNFTVDEVLKLHQPFCFPVDGTFYRFDVSKRKGKWFAGYYNDYKVLGLMEAGSEELIDALFELYCKRYDLIGF